MVRLFPQPALRKWHRAVTARDDVEYVRWMKGGARPTGWAGASLQHTAIDYMRAWHAQDHAQALELYTLRLRALLSMPGGSGPWMVQHARPRYPWLPAYLPSVPAMQPLHAFFAAHEIDPLFGGGILADRDLLLPILPCLMAYPAVLRYRDLDIFHPRWEVILKIGHHFTLDLIASRADALTEVLAQLPLDGLHVVPYR